MLYRLSALVAAVILAGTTYSVPARGASQAPAAGPQTPGRIQWDLAGLNREPFHLLKATPDPAHGRVIFLVEFTRPPTVAEQFDLEQGNSRILFLFLDEDGVALGTVVPQVAGEVVARKGARLRLVVPLPNPGALALTRTVVADATGTTAVSTPGSAATAGTAPGGAAPGGARGMAAGVGAAVPAGSAPAAVGTVTTPAAGVSPAFDRVFGGLFLGGGVLSAPGGAGTPGAGTGTPPAGALGYSSGGSGVLPNAGMNPPGSAPGSTPPGPTNPAGQQGYSGNGLGQLPNGGRNAPGTVPGSGLPGPTPGAGGTGTAPGTAPTAPAATPPAGTR